MKKNNFYKKAGFILAMVAGTYTQVSAQDNRPWVGDSKLFTRSGDNLIFANTYNPDSIKWSTDFGQFKNTNSITIGNTYYIALFVYTKDAVFFKRFFNGPTSINGTYPGERNFDTTMIIEANVLELSGRKGYYFAGDLEEMTWGVKYDNGDTATFTNKTITMTKNATVTLYGRIDGSWQKRKTYFNGIYQDQITGSLNAPILEKATYNWYYHEHHIGYYTSTFTPTELGTYKVVITWTSGSNLRTEESTTNTATFVFEVTSLPVVTGVENASLENLNNAIYPNPASDVAYINAKGAFEYSIETTNTELVGSGSGNEQVKLDLRGMNAGIYFVRIKTNEKQSVKRLIVR